MANRFLKQPITVNVSVNNKMVNYSECVRSPKIYISVTFPEVHFNLCLKYDEAKMSCNIYICGELGQKSMKQYEFWRAVSVPKSNQWKVSKA